MGTVTSANVGLRRSWRTRENTALKTTSRRPGDDLFELLAKSRTGLTLSELSRKLTCLKHRALSYLHLETRVICSGPPMGACIGLRFANSPPRVRLNWIFAGWRNPPEASGVRLDLTAALTALREPRQ